MNLGQIKNQHPDAFGQYMNREDAESTGYIEFFDELNIVAIPTYNPGHTKPWGWEVWTAEGRFIRHEGNYLNRDAAQSAAWTQAFAELQRLISQGNA